MIGDDKKLITNYTLGEVTDHILSSLPKVTDHVLPENITPEERYVTSDKLASIMKVSVQMICNMGDMGMRESAGYGDNLWDYVSALLWRKEIYYKKLVKKRGRKKQ